VAHELKLTAPPAAGQSRRYPRGARGLRFAGHVCIDTNSTCIRLPGMGAPSAHERRAHHIDAAAPRAVARAARAIHAS
jgi:hypothetical protein